MKRLGGVFLYLFHACVNIRAVVLDVWLMSARVADTVEGTREGAPPVGETRTRFTLPRFLLTITCAPLAGDCDCVCGGHMR